MKKPTRLRWIRIAAVTLGILLPLLTVELVYRRNRRPPAHPPTSFCGDCPYVFELNPSHANLSKQRLRDRDYAPTPPEGTFRVLVLGDSIAYGTHAKSEQTFPKVLEKKLDGKYGRVEVINAGVIAYTAYNEQKYWASKGKDLHPNLVIISLCLNDVVDPALHWMFLVDEFSVDSVPEEAIPNPVYHRDHAMPLARRKLAQQGALYNKLLRKSELYKRAIAPLFSSPPVPDTTVTAGGKRLPAFLTGEDTLSMEVLMDYESPEWRWLRGQYDAMVGSIRKTGAEVMVLVNPVQYQLMPGYPLFPQTLVERYCKERALRCFDVLPDVRDHGGEALFYGKFNGVVDVWHYTPAGHQVIADALRGYLEREKLLPAAKGP